MRKELCMVAAGLALMAGACSESEVKPDAVFARAAEGLPYVQERIRVGFNPIGVAVTADGNFAYVANSASNSVSKIDTASRRVVSTIQLAVSPTWIALAHQKGLACVTSREAQALILLDVQGNYQIATLDMPYSPEQVVIDASETLAYVSNALSAFVTVVDLDRRRIRQSIALTDASVGLALTPDGRFLYVSTRGTGYNLQVISTADQTVAARTNAGTAPGSIAMDPAGTYAYVANHDSNDVTLVHVPTHHAVLTIPIGMSAMDVKVSPSGRYVFVTGNQNTLFVLDTATHAVADRLGLDVSPWGMAVAPDGRALYVANYQSSGQQVDDVIRPNVTIGTGTARRVNNNTLLVVNLGKYQ